MMEWYVPFIAIGLVVLGYFAGHLFRDKTHSMIPFAEPLSYILLAVTLAPVFIMAFAPEMAVVDPFDITTLSALAAFWVGYICGYLQNRVDMLFVGVHEIVERTQDIHPIVRYTNKQGQQCWQPQGFKEICKTVFFGIHNPLTLTGNIYRTRHVSMKNVFIKIEADAVDVAGLEINEFEKEIGHLFGHTFKMRVEGRKYTPSPNCTDSPYDWIVNAIGYEDLFTEYTELQVQAAEAKAQLQGAQIKGGAMVLNALAGRTPSNIFMEEFADEFEGFVKNRSMKRRVKNASDVQNNLEVRND